MVWRDPDKSAVPVCTLGRRLLLGVVCVLWAVGWCSAGWSYDCSDIVKMTQMAAESRAGSDATARIQSLEIDCDLEKCKGPEGDLFKKKLLDLIDICVGVPYDRNKDILWRRRNGEGKRGRKDRSQTRKSEESPPPGGASPEEPPQPGDERSNEEPTEKAPDLVDESASSKEDDASEEFDARRVLLQLFEGGRQPDKRDRKEKRKEREVTLLEAAETRLRKTEFFDDVMYEAEETPGGYNVKFTVVGVTIVNDIKFSGLDIFAGPLLESEVEKRLQIREGQPLQPPLDSAPCVERTKKDKRELAIANLYEQQGYYGTEVCIEKEAVEGALQKQVDITVRINTGKKMAVGRVYIKKNKVMSYDTIRSLLLRPIGWFGQYTQSKLTEGIENVMREFRRKDHFAVRLVYKHVEEDRETDPEQVLINIFLQFDEGPRWELEFKGNKAFSDKELREQVTFVDTGYVDDVEILNTVSALRGFYETAGYYFAQIKVRTDVLGKDRRRVTFVLDEGARAEIRDIDFTGVKSMSEDALFNILGTRPYGIFDVGGFLQRPEIEADLEKVIQYYQARGFMEANVRRWRLKAENEKQELFIAIDMTEGQRTLIDKMTFITFNEDSSEAMLKDGILMPDAEVLKAMDNLRSSYDLENEKERVFSLPWLDAVKAWVIDRYQAKGYPKIGVIAKCRLASQKDLAWSDPEVKVCAAPQLSEGCLPESDVQRKNLCLPCTGSKKGEQCCKRILPGANCRKAQGGVQGESVDVALLVKTGPKAVIGEIFLRGNRETKDSVIQDELTIKRGKDFYLKEVLKNQSSLRSLELFESVSIEAIGVGEDAISKMSDRDEASLIVTVEEGPSRFWDLTVGLEGRNVLGDDPRVLLTLETGFVENNVLGYGKQIQLKFKYAFDPLEAWDQFQDADGVLESFESIVGDVDRLVASELVYRDPRFFLGRLEFSTTTFATLDLLGAELNDLDKVEYGVRPTLRKTFGEFWSVQTSFELKRTTTRNREDNPRTLEGDRLFEPWRNTFTISPRLAYDNRDSAVNPKRGWTGDVELDYAFDILDAPTQYFRLTASWAQFFNWPKSNPKPRRLVFGYGLKAGQVFLIGDTKEIPVDERFRLGGVTSVRGFEDSGIGPKDLNFQPLGGELMMVGHLSLRFPLFGDFAGFYFFDAGVLVDCLQEQALINTTSEPERLGNCFEDIEFEEDLRMSSGMGLRYLLLSQIPVGVDYGIILNRQVGEEFGQLHINIGYTF